MKPTEKKIGSLEPKLTTPLPLKEIKSEVLKCDICDTPSKIVNEKKLQGSWPENIICQYRKKNLGH